MKEITRHLQKLEQVQKITVLYACESGSRSYGTQSHMSDHDIRFIYIRPLKEYVQINEKEDVIAFKYPDIFEYQGWDLLKAMRLCKKSNPTLYEWLFSPIAYRNKENFQAKLQAVITSQYSLKTIGKHYEHLLIGNLNQLKKMDSFGMPQTKAILQCVRGLLAMNWLIQYHTLPPVSYDMLINGSNYSNNRKATFWNLRDMKQMSQPNELLFQSIIHFLEYKHDLFASQLNALPAKKMDVEKGNQFIWSIFGVK